MTVLSAGSWCFGGPLVGMVVDPEAGRTESAVVDEDYGSFRWVVFDRDDGDRSLLEPWARRVVPDPYELDLGGERFDPRVEIPRWPEGWRQSPANHADLRLVQFDGPIRTRWLRDLEKGGLRVVQYIDPFTYVVWGNSSAIEAIRSSNGVRWTGDFPPAVRVLPRWRTADTPRAAVRVLMYRGADVAETVRELEILGGVLRGRRVIDARWMIAGFYLPADRLAQCAAVPGVYSIQPAPTDGGLRGEIGAQVNAGNYDETNAAFPGYADWLDEVGFDGSGVVIADVDSGVQEDHPDLVSRFLPCVGTSCAGDASSSHGTHTAGIMAADGSSGTADPAGFLRGLGVAPGAHLIEQLYSPTYLEAGGMLLLMQESHANGAALSGNSWGPSGSPLGYDADTLQVDVGVRDADPDTAGNQQMTYVLSIMNGYGGVSTQGTPDEAKNIFTIGSTKLQNTDLTQILEIDDLSSNSAHGPALDGRIIPHMTAPGCRVDSTLPTDAHGLMCGTSMASPQVSGAVALFIEQQMQRGYGEPGPALVKASFLVVARDLAGHLDADGVVMGHPFDSKQGWGRLALEDVLDPPVRVLRRDRTVILDETGEFWGMKTETLDSRYPTRIMLVWTDAPGHGLGGTTPAWNNDFDLEVEVGGEIYRGNAFDPATGWSVAGGTADPMNNTEGVFLPEGYSGTIVVRVIGSNIDSDGVPGFGDETDQDFALVCWNCGSSFLFEDGFETGDTSRWPVTEP